MTDRTDLSPRLPVVPDDVVSNDASQCVSDTLAGSDTRVRTARLLLRKEWRDNEAFRETPSYRRFRAAYLKALYGHQFRQPGASAAPIRFPRCGSEEHPVIVYRAVDPEKPFEHARFCPEGAHMRPVRDLPDLTPDPYAWLPEWVTEGEPARHTRSVRQRYLQTLSQSDRLLSVNRRGFALSALELSESGHVAGFRAHLCTQGESVLTSDVLGFELLMQRLSGGRNRRPTSEALQSGLRPAIRLTDLSGRPSDVMQASPEGAFSPLIGFQALVVFRNPRKRGEWCALVKDNVGTDQRQAGGIDLPSAGDFLSRSGNASDRHAMAGQFDLQQALISHLLDTVFADPQVARGGNPTHCDGYQRFEESLARDHNGTRINFLGVVSDLETLRSTFSFLVVIEDEALLRHPYIVHDPDNGPYLAGWLRKTNGTNLRAASFVELEKVINGTNTFSSASVGSLTLFSELTYALDGWLYERYPDMPLLLMIE